MSEFDAYLPKRVPGAGQAGLRRLEVLDAPWFRTVACPRCLAAVDEACTGRFTACQSRIDLALREGGR